MAAPKRERFSVADERRLSDNRRYNSSGRLLSGAIAGAMAAPKRERFSVADERRLSDNRRYNSSGRLLSDSRRMR